MSDMGELPKRSSTGEPEGSRRTIFPIVVGIGASAGGLEACTALLKALPANLGMAYVFVPHPRSVACQCAAGDPCQSHVYAGR